MSSNHQPFIVQYHAYLEIDGISSEVGWYSSIDEAKKALRDIARAGNSHITLNWSSLSGRQVASIMGQNYIIEKCMVCLSPT